MNLGIDGLRIIRTTERGTIVEFEVVASSERVSQVVSSLLEALPDGAEISIPEPGENECYHECQRIDNALQIKRGCHGSFGTWRAANAKEAHEWLLPGFKESASNPRYEQALVRIPRP